MHLKNHTLQNQRVLLRPLQADDYKHLKSFAVNEPELWQYSLVQAGNQQLMQTYISLAINARQAGKQYPFIVYDKKVNAYAGSTRFYDLNLDQAYLQLGYTWYGKKFQGTGLNKHCKYLLLQFAFEQLGMHRVEFRADADNARSIAAMKSIGCTVEGILRSNGYRPNGSRRNSIVLSILKDEWERDVKSNLALKL